MFLLQVIHYFYKKQLEKKIFEKEENNKYIINVIYKFIIFLFLDYNMEFNIVKCILNYLRLYRSQHYKNYIEIVKRIT